MHTMQLMVEQERRNVEQLRQDLAGSYSTKTQQELDMAVKRLAKLESQLSDFKKVQKFLHRITIIFFQNLFNFGSFYSLP